MTQISYQPIAEMKFSGLNWIEASAGTGKTYTLSSLMVRLFLSGYLPKQVIATTFTRAAAAELKNRIRLRLQASVRYLEQHQGLTQNQLQECCATETDPLFRQILTDNMQRMDFATNRLKLALEQVDELFVGTLDSFTQKLLREFSFESGKIERALLTDQAQHYTTQLIHDVLREWIQQQPQQVIDCLVLSQKLQNVEAYIDLVEKSLNFSSAKLYPVKMPMLDTGPLEQCLNDLLTLTEQQLSEFSEYVSQHLSHFHSGYQPILVGLKACLCGLQTEIRQFGFQGYFSKPSQIYVQQLSLLLYTKEGTPRKQTYKVSFKEELRLEFEQNPVLILAKKLVENINIFDQQLNELMLYVKYYLTEQVRLRLPELLQQKGETTFAQQIRLLAEALEGEQGQRFAQVVHGRYPVILVDEFQDTNHDQDQVLAQIWRHPKWYQQGCMIMVSDPKQAIYAFRGGDMLTYNKAFADIKAKNGTIFSLKYNHRSVSELVSAVDALFQRQPDFGEQVTYAPVEAGKVHPALCDDGQLNPYPLRWLTLADNQDDAIQVAWKIRDLLNRAQQNNLYIQAEQAQVICADDIAVLAKSHKDLDRVQYELQRLDIAVHRASKRSVFDSFVAKDVAALLTAIMFPHDEAKVKRALLSRLLNVNLQQLQQLEKQPDGLSQYMYDFDYIKEMWLSKGFLTAWNYCLNLFQVWQNLVQSRSFDNERVVVNLRHLNEILSQHSEQYRGAQTLYTWYLKQVHQPLERDWEKERSLSHAHGVKLMTIHQSKGLEFKIVFLMSADSGFTDKEKLTFFTEKITDEKTGQTQEQRLIAVKKSNPDDLIAQQQHQQRLEAEQHRLWYVALTRASYRVYVMLKKDEPKNSTQKSKTSAVNLKGVYYWLNQGESFIHPHSMQEPCLSERPEKIRSVNPQPDLLYAQDFPQRQFYPRSKTSFSGLSQHLSPAQARDALAAKMSIEERAEDEIQDHHQMIIQQTQPLAWIKRYFPKGTEAGNFLHEIFEHIDFKDQNEWKLELHRRFSNDYPELWKELVATFKTHVDGFLSQFQQRFKDFYVTQAQQLLQKAQHRPFWLVKNSLIEFNQQLYTQAQQHDSYAQWLQVWQHHLTQDQSNAEQMRENLHMLEQMLQPQSLSSLFHKWQQEFGQLKPNTDHLIDLNALIEHHWTRFVDHWIEEIVLHLLHSWLQQIVETPLHSNFALKTLTKTAYLSEFPFYLALKDQILSIKKIQQLFQQQGYTILDLNPANSARYLTGSIDLVYYDGQRYHIADYKSNYLGADQAHYQIDALKQNMSKASYWLQAGLYLVALHRYLTVSLQDYAIEKHLGGASYLYLRGMTGLPSQGYCYWKPSDEFILTLDALLGYAQALPSKRECDYA